MFAFWSSYGTIKGESFEKEVLMLSSTLHVFFQTKFSIIRKISFC